MTDDQFSFRESDVRRHVKRLLQIMNHYDLTEVELENKTGEGGIHVRRSEQENYPPLLEGRSTDVEGEIRAPSIGQISWDVNTGDSVEANQVVGTIEKNDETVEVSTDMGGIIAELCEEEYVEFGQRIGSIEPKQNDNGDENDVDKSEQEGDGE
ncbi:MAG: biotin/lipoyl-containing protein [bacterium]